MNRKTYLGRISEKSSPQETALFEIPENKSGLTGLKKKKKKHHTVEPTHREGQMGLPV